MSVFSDRLRQMMDIKMVSAAELSRRTGISKPRISNYLSGNYEPKSNALHTIAKTLNVNAEWLIGRLDYNNLDVDDAEFISNLGYIHPLEELPEDIAALNAFLYCIGERIIKTNGRYFLGEIGELSDGDLKRLTTAATTSIKVTYDMILNEKRAELMSRFSNQPKKKEK